MVYMVHLQPTIWRKYVDFSREHTEIVCTSSAPHNKITAGEAHIISRYLYLFHNLLTCGLYIHTHFIIRFCITNGNLQDR